MIKRIFALLCVLLMCVSMAVCTLADTETETAAVTETAEQVEAEETSLKNIQIYILAGAVIGAMVVVTVIYKKKDEIRYL